ncbi:hypothetical protein PR202_gb01863 [Eleusine coracana subsp. coracana]|uniref:DUF4005 domain-containing protein n=1 Tax=Eleusine coracana subsp. coracana TaxID=191504 RepID=A0AAV5DYL6_ELECO|nr:hypothetical protein PR202_gb01863 [Eleusine coracana subsp. coracana]
MSLPALHRRRLSDGGGDSAFERCSPRIVEMDTCQLRCRSTRITTTRYDADTPPPPSASPLLYFYSHKQAAARLLEREREPPLPKTTHNTPRLGSAFPGAGGGLGYLGSSPAKGGTSPRYMADTASSVARSARCQSAPRQRNEAARHSLGRSGSRKQQARAMSQQDSFSFKSCSEATSRVEGSDFSDEVTRDYYLDRLW